MIKNKLIIVLIVIFLPLASISQTKSDDANPIYHYLDLDETPKLLSGESIQKYINKKVYWPEGFHGDGKVYISFVIDKDGNCKDPVIIKSIYKKCDDLSLEIINSMPKLKPGVLKGNNVNTLIITHVDFTVY